jgi:hypothetical protein
VDLERCAMGDPLEDVGDLLAHLHWEHRTKFTKGAAAAGRFAEGLAHEVLARSPGRSPRDLGFFTACASLEIGEVSLRRKLTSAAADARLAAELARLALAGEAPAA